MAATIKSSRISVSSGFIREGSIFSRRSSLLPLSVTRTSPAPAWPSISIAASSSCTFWMRVCISCTCFSIPMKSFIVSVSSAAPKMRTSLRLLFRASADLKVGQFGELAADGEVAVVDQQLACHAVVEEHVCQFEGGHSILLVLAELEIAERYGPSRMLVELFGVLGRRKLLVVAGRQPPPNGCGRRINLLAFLGTVIEIRRKDRLAGLRGGQQCERMLDRKQCRARHLELLSLWPLQLDTDNAVATLSFALGGIGGLPVAVRARAETQALPISFFPAGRAQVGGRDVAFLVDHARHETHVF